MVRRYPLFITLLLSFALMITAASTALAANIQVQPDRSVVQQDESLTLIFSSDSETDGEPDFSPLEKDFQIMNSNQSSSIQIINGRMSKQFKWQVMLMPKKSGQLTIPSINFGKDETRSIRITVKAPDPKSSKQLTEYLFMDAGIDTHEAYVQSQIIYSVRIYRALDLANATLSELKLSDPDAVVEKLTDNKTYEKVINGNRYIVFEKQYSIFPQSAGKLVIEPTEFVGQFRDTRLILRSKRMTSKRFEIDVKPVPDQIRRAGINYWLPAKDIRLTEKWSSDFDKVNVGEPVTRTLSLRANGLMASQLPELNKVQQSSDVKSYVDQPIMNNRASSRGMEGSREEKIAYVPSKPGKLTLPAIEIKWWNTKTNKMEIARLPERVITAFGEAASDSAAVTNDLQPQDIFDAPARQPRPLIIQDSRWIWMSGVFGTLWLLTMLFWWRSARKVKSARLVNEDDDLQGINTRIALQKLKTACEHNDSQKAKQFLIQWGRHQWPEKPPTSIGHVAQRVNGVLSKELNRLNDVLYNPNSQGWKGDSLWLAVKLFVQQRNGKQKTTEDSIKPLFKLAVDDKQKEARQYD